MAEGLVLTTGSTVTCSHPVPGPVTLTGAAKLKVGGKPVLLSADLVGATVTCANSDPNTGTKKCTKVTAVTAGAASKLKVLGKPVLSDRLAGSTDGTPAEPPATGPGLTCAPVQGKLKTGGK